MNVQVANNKMFGFEGNQKPRNSDTGLQKLVTYVDCSTIPDPDQLSPLTPIGRVPNFPAKLHAILCRKDISDVICWLPHGRSWRILKHRDFETFIMPKYFGHCKLSSFLRQAASWGFRRIATGISIDSYVHPLFLRGLPHLCKLMKRHATDKERGCRLALDDLDLDRFSKTNPLPEDYTDESVLLPFILQEGPKARMPVLTKWKPNIFDFNDKSVTKTPTSKASCDGSNDCVPGSSGPIAEPNNALHSVPLKSAKANPSSVYDLSRRSIPRYEQVSNHLLATLADVSTDRSQNYEKTIDATLLPHNITTLFPSSDIAPAFSLPTETSMYSDTKTSLRQRFSNSPLLNSSQILLFGEDERHLLTPKYYDLLPPTAVTDPNAPHSMSDATAMSLFSAGFAAAAAMNAKQSMHLINQSNEVMRAYELMFTHH
jgi:HSF-type DNA-binding